MFAVFGKSRPEEEKRRRLVYDKEQSKWHEDTRKWKRLSNARYQISPEYWYQFLLTIFQNISKKIKKILFLLLKP